MKAILLNKYGSPDDLTYEDVPDPKPKEGEVLVEVHASTINDWELGLMRGRPLFLRFFLGFTRPKIRIMGCDVAGRVAAVGPGVEDFAPGDDVYGDLSDAGFGAFAERVCVPEQALESIPEGLTYEGAATLPHAVGLAVQGLRDLGQLRDGQRLLINGAGGGVGAFGVPYAKQFDVEVTGVDHAGKLDFLRRLGCDHVVDYTREDFTRRGERYDLILDTKTTRSPFAYARALREGGRYVTVGGSMACVGQVGLLAPFFARLAGKKMQVLGLEPNRGLADVAPLLEAGAIAPAIGERYALRDVPRALRAFEESRHTGRIVISVRGKEPP